MHNIYQNPRRAEVEDLLRENLLPTEDLTSLDMQHFFACRDNDGIRGVIGLETHGTDGLLRSLAVSSSARNLGYASALVHQLEEHAIALGIRHLYLLTETAERYFEKRGYSKINREMASDTIKRTREFSELCPASATVMRKRLKF